MKSSSKTTFGLVAVSVATAATIIATTAGSLAWYAYNRTGTVSYVGTSVSKSILLNVGIVDPDGWISQATIDQYELSRESFDGTSIVFTHSTSGFDYHAIQEYLLNANHAFNMLFPLTTQARTLTDQNGLSLYKSPDYGDTSLTIGANPADYSKIPFAFRIGDASGAGVSNKDIWLTDATVQASGEHIDQAVRIFVENSQRKFLMKPADKSMTNSSTKVGGLLDLDGDGTYDFNRLSPYNEYYYGQYKTSGSAPTNASTAYGVPTELQDYDNVNGVATEYQEESTFYSKHNPEAHIVNNLENVEADVVEHYTFGTVKPMIDSNGDYYAGTTGIPICRTDFAHDNIGYADLTIYIEGWDHSVVDRAAGYTFNLGLKFEINRI